MVEIDQSNDTNHNQTREDTIPFRYPHFELYTEENTVVITSMNPFGIKDYYTPLRILPDPVDDTDNEFDIFVKDYSLKDKKEPPSYNQELPGLEANHKHVKRLRVPGKVILAIHREMSKQQ